MVAREPLQRPDSQKDLAFPHRPEVDVGRLQPVEVQGVRAARRRFRAGAGQMGPEQIDEARIAEVAGNDPHWMLQLLHGWQMAPVSRNCRKSAISALISPRHGYLTSMDHA